MEAVLSLRGFSHTIKSAPKDFLGDFFTHLLDHFIPHYRNDYHPHIFSHRLTSLLTLLLVAVKVFSVSYLTFGPVLPAYSSAITTENIISLTNESRTSFGIKALLENSILTRAAQAKANDMAQLGYFAHVSPEGRTPWNFIEKAGYNYILAGENLAVNFTQAESVEQAWMNSPSHKANILNSNFKEIGIGIAEGKFNGTTSTFVVQMFGVPAEQKIVLKTQTTAIESQTIPFPAIHAGRQGQAGLEILDADATIAGNQLNLTVKSSSDAVKVLAVYGQRALWLYPRPENFWYAQLSLDALVQTGARLKIEAYDINGKMIQKPIASFASDAQANYNYSGQVAGKQARVLGKVFDLQNFQDRFYLIFLSLILCCLVLAIAIRRHIQHLSIVANGSFVAILAILLWMG